MFDDPILSRTMAHPGYLLSGGKMFDDPILSRTMARPSY